MTLARSLKPSAKKAADTTPVELVTDTFYPPLYAVSRVLALWWLTTPGRMREGPLPLKLRYALIALPVLMASLDLIENACIAVMLLTWLSECGVHSGKSCAA